MKKHKISQILDFVAAQNHPVRRKDIVNFICDLNGYNGQNRNGYYSVPFSGQKIFRYTKKGLKCFWKTGDLRCPHKWDNRFLEQDKNGLYFVVEGTWVKGEQYTELGDSTAVIW